MEFTTRLFRMIEPLRKFRSPCVTSIAPVSFVSRLVFQTSLNSMTVFPPAFFIEMPYRLEPLIVQWLTRFSEAPRSRTTPPMCL